MFGALILGPYQLGFQIFIVLLIIPNIVTQYTLPHDATGIKNKSLKKYTMIISGIITGLVVILTPPLIPIFFPKYIESIEVNSDNGICTNSFSFNNDFNFRVVG